MTGGIRPWEMERLKLREWKMIRDALTGGDVDGGEPGGLPDGWESLPVEEVV